MNHQVDTQNTELETQELEVVTGGLTPTSVEMLACRKAGGTSEALLPAVQKTIIAV